MGAETTNRVLSDIRDEHGDACPVNTDQYQTHGIEHNLLPDISAVPVEIRVDAGLSVGSPHDYLLQDFTARDNHDDGGEHNDDAVETWHRTVMVRVVYGLVVAVEASYERSAVVEPDVDADAEREGDDDIDQVDEYSSDGYTHCCDCFVFTTDLNRKERNQVSELILIQYIFKI